MKTAIFTTISDPNYWQYAFKESLECYSEIADEVVVVDGSLTEFEFVQFLCKQRPNVKYIRYPWPYEFQWQELPNHIQRGFENVSSDVDIAIKMDIDYFIHENDVSLLKKFFALMLSKKSGVGSLVKYNMVNKTSYFNKAVVPIVVNMNFRDQIEFGRDRDDKTDWCFPISKRFRHQWEPEDNAGIGLYNYDYFFRTKEKAAEAFYRFSLAAQKDFNHREWGNTLDESERIVIDRYKGMGNRKLEKVISHPKWIKDRVLNMTEHERGFNNWGLN